MVECLEILSKDLQAKDKKKDQRKKPYDKKEGESEVIDHASYQGYHQ